MKAAADCTIAAWISTAGSFKSPQSSRHLRNFTGLKLERVSSVPLVGFRWRRPAERSGKNVKPRFKLSQHFVTSTGNLRIFSFKHHTFQPMQIQTVDQNTNTHPDKHATPVCDYTVDFTPSCTNTESALSQIAQRSNDQRETVALWLWEGLLNCPSISSEIPVTHILRHQPNGAHCPLLDRQKTTFPYLSRGFLDLTSSGRAK